MPPLSHLKAFPDESLDLFSGPASFVKRSIPESIITTPPPKPGIFSAVFNGLLSFTVLSGLFSNINSIWNFLHPLHQKNTALAQLQVDKEYLEEHNEEWDRKHALSEVKKMMILGREKPYFFARGYILNKEEGSEIRKVYNGILKKLNPGYWERNREILGEATEWEESMQLLKEGRLGQNNDENMETNEANDAAELDTAAVDEIDVEDSNPANEPKQKDDGSGNNAPNPT